MLYKLTLPLILASASPVRHKMLLEMGISHRVIVSTVDEEQEKNGIKHLSISDQAKKLAYLKGLAISQQYPQALVLSADQIGEYQGNPLYKPLSYENNIALLTLLSGHTHYQHTAACLFYQGEAIMNFFEMVSLTMRKLSIEEIIAYVDMAQPWNCCGGYRYEALGKHLFAHIKGDPDSVLGLPLLQILTYLHQQNYLQL